MTKQPTDYTPIDIDTVSYPQTQNFSIFFDGSGELMPCDDITAKEAVLLAMALCGASSQIIVNMKSFIIDNHLERHFKP